MAADYEVQGQIAEANDAVGEAKKKVAQEAQSKAKAAADAVQYKAFGKITGPGADAYMAERTATKAAGGSENVVAARIARQVLLEGMGGTGKTIISDEGAAAGFDPDLAEKTKRLKEEFEKTASVTQDVQAGITNLGSKAEATAEDFDVAGSEAAAAASENDYSGMATGGFVPGVGDKDSVPAMLMPGEFVMNKDSTRRFAWLLKSLNANKYATGGLVGGSLVGAPPDASTAGPSITPRFSINIRGDSVNKIMKTATTQLYGHLNKMLVPQGSTGRMFDMTST